MAVHSSALLGKSCSVSPLKKNKQPPHHLCLTTVVLCDMWEVTCSVSWKIHGDHKMVSDCLIAQLIFLACSVNEVFSERPFTIFFPPRHSQANAIGRGAKSVREFLEKNYTDEAIETDDLTIKLVIKALLEVSLFRVPCVTVHCISGWTT